MSRSSSPRNRLVHHVQELERLEAEKQAAAEALREAFDSARQAGFDPATLKVVLRLRKMTPAQRKEKRALEAIYLASLGMLEGDPLPEEARRRLDEQESPPPTKRGSDPETAGETAGEQKPPPEQEAKAPAPPAQPQLPLKEPEEARQEGQAAAAAGKRIYDNPYPAGDPCRAAWDEGWCAQKKSHGMDTPAAYQRRSKPPDRSDKDTGDGKGASA